VVEVWAWLLWTPLLLLAGWAARGPELVGVVLLSSGALLVLQSLRALVLEPGATTAAVVALGVPLIVGAALGARQRAGAALLDQRGRADRALAHQGALAERARIAREMHDVVAHHMSMIAVRAETAPYRLVDVSPSVRAELAEVAAAARQSLGEMQNLLGVLRDGDEVERAPQPGIGELTTLLSSSRAAGADVSWDLHRPEVPPALGLTAYRIVQQCLANAAQHAAGSPVQVRLDHRDGQLRIQVVNGPGSASSTPGSGAGLLGMRERALVHGGSLEAAPTPDGGFAVSATLPIGQPA
jgi:signal transduction histidine kinase